MARPLALDGVFRRRAVAIRHRLRRSFIIQRNERRLSPRDGASAGHPRRGIVNRLRLLVAAAALVLSAMSAPSQAAVYRIDPDHSDILLSCTHLGIGTVQGRFGKFSGTIEYDPKDLGASRVLVKIDAASIDTHQEFRDTHLRSSDFLDVETYPEITFASAEVTRMDSSRLKVLGNLSMHGTTHPMILLAKLGGIAQDMDGKNRIALTITGSIDRRNYNMVWNRMVGTSALVGQMIGFDLNVEGVEETPEGK
jgi:polyisoprenoid-binding protein YceI